MTRTGRQRRRREIAVASALMVAGAIAAPAQVAVRGEVVHTMAGAALRPGVVIARDGKIDWVGPAAQARIPDGFRVLEAAVVTPGLVDAHSVVGLAGILNNRSGGNSQVMDQDQLELSTAIQPQLRAVDAYNAREELVAYLRSFGVTTVHTGHGPGALASGQTMIVKTRGDTVEEAVVEPLTMIAFTLGPGVSSRYKSPGTRAKGVAMLRAELIKAQRYVEKQANEDAAKRPDPDLELDALAKVLRREVPALVTAQTATEIMTALRLQKEFGFDLVLDGAAEAYLVLDEIRAAGVPVLLHPTMVRPGGELENAAFDTAAEAARRQDSRSRSRAATSPTCRRRAWCCSRRRSPPPTASPSTRRWPPSPSTPRASSASTSASARSSSGKDADLALFDGDPFEYTSRVCGVVIEGEVVSEQCR